jgi:hypothetical protein
MAKGRVYVLDRRGLIELDRLELMHLIPGQAEVARQDVEPVSDLSCAPPGARRRRVGVKCLFDGGLVIFRPPAELRVAFDHLLGRGLARSRTLQALFVPAGIGELALELRARKGLGHVLDRRDDALLGGLEIRPNARMGGSACAANLRVAHDALDEIAFGRTQLACRVRERLAWVQGAQRLAQYLAQLLARLLSARVQGWPLSVDDPRRKGYTPAGWHLRNAVSDGAADAAEQGNAPVP